MTRRIVLLLFLLFASPALGGEETVYRGENALFEDTVWEGNILVDGILTIPPGVTLEIRPGTTVRFTHSDPHGVGIGEHEIFVQGRLKAVGTAEAPILFTSAESQGWPGAWGAINMMVSEEGNRLEHCIIEYAYRGFHAHFSRMEIRNATFRNNVRGMQFQESDVVISRSRVAENLNGMQFRDSQVLLEDTIVADNAWGVRCVYSEVELRRCRIERNLVNGVNLRDSTIVAAGNAFVGNRRGIYLQRSRGTVEGNTVLDSSEHGIFLEDSDCRVLGNDIHGNGRSGVRWVNSRGLLQGNNLSGNGAYAMVNDGTGPANARGNWWGTTDPQQIVLMVRDGRERTGKGEIDFAEPLAAPPLN